MIQDRNTEDSLLPSTILRIFWAARTPRFARSVWDIDTSSMTEKQAAEAGLKAMECWMNEIGVVMHSSELGVTEDNIEGIADATFLLDGGYKALTREEVIEILRESL